MELCREVARKSNLSSGSISVKVCDFKSLSGINNKSNASNNSKIIYKKYDQYTEVELEKLISELITNNQTK